MSLYRIVFTWLALGSLALAVAPANRTPYISIYYVQPTVNVGDAATIDYYVTDFHQKEYLDDDVSERFTIEYWVNGVRSVLTDVPAGDQSLNLGVLPQGNVLFAFQATDRLGVKSHRLIKNSASLTRLRWRSCLSRCFILILPPLISRATTRNRSPRHRG